MSVNKVTLIGNVGKDPELRRTNSGMAVCSLSVATTSKKKGGEEETQWHRVTFFDKLAEIAGEYLKKGSSVYIEGSIKYGKYTDKDGQERHTTDIIASEMKMLGGRKSDDKPKAAPAAKEFEDDSIPF